MISEETSPPPLFSVSHRSQPQQPSQPQRTLLQHVAQSQTATQTSVVVKSIPASSPGAITHIMQQVVPPFLLIVSNYGIRQIRLSLSSIWRRRHTWIVECIHLWGMNRDWIGGLNTRKRLESGMFLFFFFLKHSRNSISEELGCLGESHQNWSLSLWHSYC